MAPENEESQHSVLLRDALYDDPSQLSQALRQRTGTDLGYHLQFTTSTEQRLSVSPAKAARHVAHSTTTGDCHYHHNASSSTTRVLAAPADTRRDFVVPSRRAPENARYVKPSFPKHHTAPTSTDFVNEREGKVKMNHTFNGALDAPGDTQPDSQIYKDFTSGIYGSNSHDIVIPKPHSLFDLVDQDADIPTDSVEAVSSSQEQHQQQQSPTITNPTVADENDLRLRSTVAPTSPLKFETPAMAGRKRDNQGQLLSSAMRTVTTPGTTLTAAAIFGPGMGANGIGNNMTLTQIFNATQAATSPIIGVPSEDAVFQRPSPTFANARNSSPNLAMSSPIKHPHSDFPLRSSSEPRAEYHTMKQSQDRRSHTRDHILEDTDTGAQDSWDEPTPAEKRSTARKAREQFDREAGKSFAQVSAPFLSSPLKTKKKGRTLLSVTKTPKFHPPPAPRSRRRNAYDGPYDDDEQLDEDLPGETADPETENRNRGPSSSPDILSQDVPSAPASAKRKIATPTKVLVPNTSSHPHNTLSGRAANSPSTNPVLAQSRRGTAGSQSGKRTSLMKSSKGLVIMDSQPEAASDSDGFARPKSILIPSSPSTNQYSIDQTTVARKTGYTSQFVPSSIPPMPPKSSSSADGDIEAGLDPEAEDRVPSSPPIIVDGDNEDDVVYDEHDYDEHQSAGDEEEIVLSDHSEQDGDLPLSPHSDQELEPEYDENAIPESQHVDDEDDDTDPNLTITIVNPDVPGAMNMDGAVNDIPFDDKQLQGDVIRSSHPEEKEPHLNHVSPGPIRLTRQSTVPESDLMEDTQPSIFPQTGDMNNANAHDMGAMDKEPHQTNSADDFDTAREHQSTSQFNNGLKATPVDRESEKDSQTPQFRTFREIRERPDTQRSTNDDTEIDIPVLTFGEGSDTSKETDPDMDPVGHGSSVARSATKKRKAMYSSKNMTYASQSKRPSAVDANAPSSPLKQVQASVGTPPSTMEREERGARAAAHARDKAVISNTATLKSTRFSKPSKTKPQRKGALKPVSQGLLKTPPKDRVARRSLKLMQAVDTQPDVEMPDVDGHESDMTDELARSTTEVEKSDDEVEDESGSQVEDFTEPVDRGEAPTGDVMLPNRCFAPWTLSGYHPATCVDQVNASHFLVRFDDYDGQTRTCHKYNMRLMDLKIGDHVRVFRKGMKKNVYIIVGFKDKLDPEKIPQNPQADRLGYQTVVLEQRRSTSVSEAELMKPATLLDVRYEWIYMQTTDMHKISDREFQFTPPAGTAADYNSADEPASSIRKLKVDRQPSHRSGSVSSSRKGSNAIFANIAFAISLSQDSTDRVGIEKLIVENGGTLIEGNFDEIFEPESELDSFTGSAKGKRKSIAFENENLVLRKKYKSLRFVALIVDSHGRRLKYLQALALGIPCLHYRWLQDSRTKSAPQPSGRYMLPAGTSYYLDPSGVIISRTLPIYPLSDEDLSFRSTLQNRQHLFDGYNVLLVVGKNQKGQDKMKPYHFLLRAMGPNNVGLCVDLTTAIEMLQDGFWDWVFVEGNVHGVIDAHNVIFHDKKMKGAPPKAHKKRKRDSSVDAALVKSGVMGEKTVRVATEEFIVQCLIHNEVIEEL
ncbi:hypothetical protein B0J11DRAFT_518175 [Dendryphion nanum]|uniref:BRCT domain-containing protein n=1 Tax=Dendryphion nanum TaxID=256645 RepID=A0A9P9EF10_9PLEO|nr:hypothetical protein B0J11DRAFT_518175 [Dendryphion nanum]